MSEQMWMRLVFGLALGLLSWGVIGATRRIHEAIKKWGCGDE